MKLVKGYLDKSENQHDWGEQRVSVPSICWYGTATSVRETRQSKVDERLNNLHKRSPALQRHLLGASSRKFRYGFEVHDYVREYDLSRREGEYLEGLKLQFDSSQVTADVSKGLEAKIRSIQQNQRLAEAPSPINDYLKNLLSFVKQYLEQYTDFRSNQDACSVEFVICVPAAWDEHATTRMEQTVATAIGRSGIVHKRHPDRDNFFIVSEPEAASLSVLQSNSRQIKVSTVRYPISRYQ